MTRRLQPPLQESEEDSRRRVDGLAATGRSTESSDEGASPSEDVPFSAPMSGGATFPAPPLAGIYAGGATADGDGDELVAVDVGDDHDVSSEQASSTRTGRGMSGVPNDSESVVVKNDRAGPMEQFRLLLSRSWRQVNRAKFANITRVSAASHGCVHELCAGHHRPRQG